MEKNESSKTSEETENTEDTDTEDTIDTIIDDLLSNEDGDDEDDEEVEIEAILLSIVLAAQKDPDFGPGAVQQILVAGGLEELWDNSERIASEIFSEEG